MFQVYNDLCLREGKGHIRESKSKSSVIAFDTVQMDRHKIAACMAGAILQVGILSEPENVDHNGRTMLSYFANETLAVFAGLAIVKSYIRSDTDNRIGFPDELLVKKD